MDDDRDAVIELAVKVLGERKRAHQWLRRVNLTLGGIAPLEAMDTESGRLQVERELGRIEHGEIS